MGRLESQLSDCLNCASADSPKGKSDIQALTVRIARVKAQLEAAQRTGESTASRAVRPAQPADPSELQKDADKGSPLGRQVDLLG